eukprot:CAMPEP_0183292442 /NCGR_PEP_ID=MMETSP0160_2-20130417/1498_1 /TAXON_ID=2839 ORGANISM="Odontella Sinensis, Strain Grunow 1884" /NCGR_SAMPLE_ID=MMETSP0160_2 /ASSEMBLY_ACC=CAM_ASM_000250 /LENGTH=109 /DNA_ID=CAMNT_0025453389 /DNA_START=12 /DNA_END=338 /DNA_ORIENTATION=-
MSLDEQDHLDSLLEPDDEDADEFDEGGTVQYVQPDGTSYTVPRGSKFQFDGIRARGGSDFDDDHPAESMMDSVMGMDGSAMIDYTASSGDALSISRRIKGSMGGAPVRE